jgi:hypothetical protein
MIDEEIETSEHLFHQLFLHSAEALASLAGVIEQIRDDAVDVRTILRVAVESASHDSLRLPFTVISENYERAMEQLLDCGDRIRDLVALFVDADYSNRIETGRLKSPEGVSRDTIRQMISVVFELKAKMTGRESDWSAALINLAGLVRGIDGAQARVLNRPSKLEAAIEVAKPLIMWGIDLVAPIGLLAELAKTQTPHIDKYLDKMHEAGNTYEPLHIFGDFLVEQIKFGEFTLERVADAEKSEREFLEKFNAAFGLPA